MAAFFNALASFSRTYGQTINGEVQKVLWVAKTRKYPSAAQESLAERAEYSDQRPTRA